jgi:hypothetical protein
VTFRDSGKEKHSYNTLAIVEEKEEEYKDISSKINLDFMLDVTDALGLKVFTNTKTDDYIDLHGNGTIQAIYDEKEGFTMNGKLNLERGTYKFTIQDIFPKEFSIIKGSSIHFRVTRSTRFSTSRPSILSLRLPLETLPRRPRSARP